MTRLTIYLRQENMTPYYQRVHDNSCLYHFQDYGIMRQTTKQTDSIYDTLTKEIVDHVLSQLIAQTRRARHALWWLVTDRKLVLEHHIPDLHKLSVVPGYHLQGGIIVYDSENY